MRYDTLSHEPRTIKGSDIIAEAHWEGQSLEDENHTNQSPPAVIMTWTPDPSDPQDIGKITVRFFPHLDESNGDVDMTYWSITPSSSPVEMKLPPQNTLNLTPKYPGTFVGCVAHAAAEIAQTINRVWGFRWNISKGTMTDRKMVRDALAHVKMAYKN